MAAFFADTAFGFDLVPCSQMIRIGQERGVFMEFLSGYKEASEAFAKLETRRTSYTIAECTLFQKMAIFDVFIGNLDRHEENWFVFLDERGYLVALKCIDNGNCFPRESFSKFSFAFGVKRYLWKNLRIAQEPFTQSLECFIQDHLTQERLEAFISFC